MDLAFWKNTNSEEIHQRVAAEENRAFVIKVMKALETDPVWTESIIKMIELGQVETRCFVAWLARELQPENYLEVGVRRGFSMAMVAARSPETEIYGFDMWIPNYANVANPGQEFVKSEMRKIGYKKEIHLIGGDSHQTLPVFFDDKIAGFKARLKSVLIRRNRPSRFNLITIDGDHTLLGAYQDLSDTMPHCAVGGAVVFDDILPGALGEDQNGNDPYNWKNLLGVWHAIKQEFPNFLYFEFLQNIPGVGLAVRIN